MTNFRKFILFVCIAPLFISCSKKQKESSYPEKIFYGGEIITVSDQESTVEAVAIKDGKIFATGTKVDVFALSNKQTIKVDLKGKALVPGFIDPHSHYFSSLSVANQVNLYPPPSGPGKDIKSIVKALLDHSKKVKLKKGELIQAYGYDENVMPEGRHLNRDDLDQAFPENPVIIGHVSMHGGVLNSMALKKWNISSDTKTPEGGIIIRKDGTNEPFGLIMETAWIPIFESLPKPSSVEEIVKASIAGQKLYAAHGVTTAHEGATHANEVDVMMTAAQNGANLIDIVSFPFITELDKVLAKHPIENWGSYNNGLKLGGVKITIDGSPQGRTAAFTKPYLLGGPSGEKNWTGELTFPENRLSSL